MSSSYYREVDIKSYTSQKDINQYYQGFFPIKHKFWACKRKSPTMRHFFYIPKTYVIIDSYQKRSWIGPILWIQRVPNLFIYQFSNIRGCTFNYYFQRQSFYDSIEEMLTKLDEFGGLVDMVSQNLWRVIYQLGTSVRMRYNMSI